MHLVYIVHFKTGGQDITKANIHCNHVGQCLLLQYLQVGQSWLQAGAGGPAEIVEHLSV